MKIHKVNIEGFGAYKGKERVDFDAFAADGKFVITGKTGAGKTTILDAITYALFGRVPRYNDTADEHVRSRYLADSANPTEVSVEFSVGEDRYLVTRRPAYLVPGRKTPVAAFAEISALNGTDWETLASRNLREVAAKIDDIVRLNPQQFQQVILLAQGRFQEFLIADSKTRRELLRKLFNTNRFLDYSTDLDIRAAALKKSLDLTTEAISTNAVNIASEAGRERPATLDVSNGAAVLAWAEPIVAEQKETVGKLEAVAAEKKRLYDKASAALTEAERINALQRRKAQAETRKTELAAKQEYIDAARVRLGNAEKAEVAWLAVDSEREAAAELAKATAARTVAAAAYAGLFDDESPTAESLRERVTVLTGEVVKLDELVPREEALGQLAKAAEKAAATLEGAHVNLAALESKQTQMKQSGPELDRQIATLANEASNLAPAETRLAAVSTQLENARAAEKTAAELEKARTTHAKASAAVEAATGARTKVLKQRLAEHAGVLAESLTDGEACAVCGSTTHPSPAKLSTSHVTEADVDKAEAAAQRAQAAYESASSNVSVLTERLRAQTKAAIEQPVAVLEAEYADAEAARDATASAQARHATLTGERAQVQNALAAVADEIAQAKEARATAESEANHAMAVFANERKAIEDARGDFASVSLRVKDAKSRCEVSQRLLDTTATRDKAQEAASKAGARLAGVLAEQGFEAASSVESARLPKAEREKLSDQISMHAADTEAAKQILAEKDLQNLPAEPVDLTPLRSARDTAESSLHDATIALGQAQTRSGSVENLFKEIQKKLKEAASEQKNYAVVNRLALTVRGQMPNTKKMTLETFALAADLEEIVAAANVLLSKMTAHRYELRYSDELAKHGGQSGLAIEVNDAYNEETRPPQSLSGGEKFQASLALALGLAEVVTSRNGGVRLDTLFIDEGFGALDSETLDVTLDTIDALREGGRTVGLISHVEQVKERITNHIGVSVTEHGWSTLKN
ncbi:AAA family ATPase [Sinomonas sp. P47F7]|uniref:AAA family ATPase n=1 Tax=Sinomonas sp. P47F7 TaxID=3410987 RepID=UPI003BF59C15